MVETSSISPCHPPSVCAFDSFLHLINFYCRPMAFVLFSYQSLCHSPPVCTLNLLSSWSSSASSHWLSMSIDCACCMFLSFCLFVRLCRFCSVCKRLSIEFKALTRSLPHHSSVCWLMMEVCCVPAKLLLLFLIVYPLLHCTRGWCEWVRIGKSRTAEEASSTSICTSILCLWHEIHMMIGHGLKGEEEASHHILTVHIVYSKASVVEALSTQLIRHLIRFIINKKQKKDWNTKTS